MRPNICLTGALSALAQIGKMEARLATKRQAVGIKAHPPGPEAPTISDNHRRDHE